MGFIPRLPRLKDLTDIVGLLTAGNDGKALTWNNSGSAFGMTALSSGTGDMMWAVIQASQLTNEIKGWRPVVNAGDLDALNLWFDKVGTPTTAPTVTDTSVAGLTDSYELCLKVTADASGEGLSQTWTFADEPRVKAGRVLSTIWAIRSVSGVGVTLKLVNSDASHTDATAVTAAAWTIVTVENHTLADTTCTVQLVTDGAGTFYAVPLGANIGAKAVPFAPRPGRYVDIGTQDVVSAVDPNGADFTDVDLTAQTSNLCYAVQLIGQMTGSVGNNLSVRRNGDTTALNASQSITRGINVSNSYTTGIRQVFLDDGQIFEYKTGATAGTSELVYFHVAGWWEWA